MNRLPKRTVLALISALTAVSGSAYGQAVADPAADTEPLESGSSAAPTAAEEDMEDEEMIILDPFTVSADHEGYKADDTLAGGRIRTSLKDTPSSLQVVTKKLMDDLGVTNAEEMLRYTTSTEVAGIYGNYSGVAERGIGVNFGSKGSVEGNRLLNPAGVNRARGLTGLDNTRNFMPSDVPWDGFNIGRFEISRGPNSFLFGTGSPSGIMNVATNEAGWKDRGSVEFRYGSFGSARQSLDYNKVLLENQLAIRVDLVNSETKFQQKPAFNDSQRVYGALRYDPEFLRTDTMRTKILASYEHGEITSNNPRSLPPVDYITGYLNDPKATATSPSGIDPWMYTQSGATSSDHRYSHWTSAGSVGGQYQTGGPNLYWDGTTGALLAAGQPLYSTPTGNGYGASSNTWNVHTTGFGSYARTLNYIYTKELGYSDADAPFTGSYADTVRYLDQTLSDPTVYDFYNKLIDGDNKREWQDWDAYNLSITQTLFDDRLAIQGVVDGQKVKRGYSGPLTNRTPILMLDLNSKLLNAGYPTWLGGAVSNPNVGRPLVFSDQGGNNSSEINRENYQVTAAYNIDFSRDFNMDGLLGSILGRHDITALWGKYERTEESREYRLNGVDSSYSKITGQNTNALLKDTEYNWTAYVGPSLLGTTGANANISNLSTFKLPSAVNFSVYSNLWTAGASVDPTADWVYTGKDGSTVTQKQVDNPANYLGYVPLLVPIIDGADKPAELATGGSKRLQIITSKALMYQGHFWDDTIIPSFGYRRDTTKQRGGSPVPPTKDNGQVYNFDYDYAPGQATATTSSMSYGVALHLPKFVKKHLPAGTDLTFFYFHGENETPRVRYGLDGKVLPNESGETDDYSVQFDGLDGRLTARLTYFKTANKNAFASVGEPLGTWEVQGLPPTFLQYGAYALIHRNLPKDENGYFMVPASWHSWTKEGWANWPYGWMDDDYAAKLATALSTHFANFYDQAYFDAWGYNFDMEAVKAGDWMHIVKGTDNPFFPPELGGRSTINGEYPTIDQNLESKGLELEVNFRPLKNWDITFNGSKVDATQTGYGEAASKFLVGMKGLYLDTDVGYAFHWGGKMAARKWFLSSVWTKYLTQTALIGGEQPEQRKYHFNVMSNYRFETGVLKGLNIGGAFRWEDKAILGYHIHETVVDADASGWIANVNDPIYGPTEEHLDMWAGYGRKLNEKIDWRLQLNVRNVGEDDHLVTIAVQPDGTPAQRRIAGGQAFDVTMKFSF